MTRKQWWSELTDTARAIREALADYIVAPVGIGEEPCYGSRDIIAPTPPGVPGLTYRGRPWIADQPTVGIPFWRLARFYWHLGTPGMRALIARDAMERTLREFQPGRSPRRSWWRRFFEPPAGPQRGGKAYW